MIKYESIKAHDGTAIRAARFEAQYELKGVIQIIHGFGEGLVHYKDVAGYFTDNGYACVIHDQRGFGEMPDMSTKQRHRARGVAPGYKYLLDDVNTVRRNIDVWYPDVPVILYGYSMGANIAACYLIKSASEPNLGESGVSQLPNDAQYAKVILESPWLRLYKPLPKFTTLLARLIGKASGNVTISSSLNMDAISRNGDIAKNLRHDNVFHTRMSLRLYAEIVAAGEYVLENADKIVAPTLLLCPGADKIVCPKAIREFARRANANVMLTEYADGYHCLHADTINAEVMAAMLDFCSGRE